MRLDFLVRPEDVKEDVKFPVETGRRIGSRLRFGGLYGWLFFVGIAALFFVWLKRSSAIAPPPPPPLPASPWDGIIVPLIPWVLILAFVWWFVFRNRFKKAWDANPIIQQPQTLEMNEEGVRVSNPLTESFYRWPSFTGSAETANLFLLLLPNRQRLVIPKRTATDAQLQEIRTLIQSHARAPVGGFALLAPKPVLAAEDVER